MSTPTRQPLADANPDLFKQVVRSLRMIFDPEIPVNVYDLGLIYALELDGPGKIYIQMTLTAPNCPEAERIPETIYQAVLKTEGVEEVDLELVFEPSWSRDNMSTAALLALGLI
jgi:FeS assembly SUF system protein